MPRKFELTWHKARHCWKKVYHGKTYYCPVKCRGKSDLDGYQASMQWWREKKFSLDAQAAVTRDESWMLGRGLEHMFDGGDDLLLTDEDYAAYHAISKPITERRISEVVQLYLSQLRAEVDAEPKRLRTYTSEKAQLEAFLKFLSTTLPAVTTMDRINEQLLALYKTARLKSIKTDGGDDPTLFFDPTTPAPARRVARSATTARKRLATLKRWIKWCYKNRYIDELPRNLDDLSKVPLAPPNPKFYDAAEVKTLFQAANRRARLYIALALNCGFTQGDIASLTHDMLDLSSGILTREREKTGKPSKHKLWPVTLALLQQEMTPESAGVLLVDRDGKRLLHEQLNEQGNLSRRDTIRRTFYRLVKKVGLPADGRSFKTFRKTGANEIAKRFQDTPHVVDFYLAHTEKAVKRFYTHQHYDLLFDALEYLDELYDLQSLQEPESCRRLEPNVTP